MMGERTVMQENPLGAPAGRRWVAANSYWKVS